MNSAHEKRKCAPFLPSPPPFGTSTATADICPIQICIGERSHPNSPSDLDLLLRQTGLARLNLTRNQLSALEDFTRSIPQLYNSSWKAAISDVLAKNAQILQDRWLSDIRLDVIEQLKGQQGLAVHVDATYPGSVLVVVNGSHPIDSMLNNTLAQLNGQLSVTLSVTGPYFPSAEQELYYFTDPYFHNLRKCNGAEHCSDSDLFLASL